MPEETIGFFNKMLLSSEFCTQTFLFQAPPELLDIYTMGDQIDSKTFFMTIYYAILGNLYKNYFWDFS